MEGLARRELCPSLIISPGPGTDGSLSCRFIKTVDRRLPAALEVCRLRDKEPLGEPGRVSMGDG